MPKKSPPRCPHGYEEAEIDPGGHGCPECTTAAINTLVQCYSTGHKAGMIAGHLDCGPLVPARQVLICERCGQLYVLNS